VGEGDVGGDSSLKPSWDKMYFTIKSLYCLTDKFSDDKKLKDGIKRLFWNYY